MRRRKIMCPMCGIEFYGRMDAKTCSPRCRKRRSRVIDGTAIASWPMGVPPNPRASKMWR